MYQTSYHRPKTLAEAAALLGSAEDAAYLSGGHTLLPAIKGRLAAPEKLIDLRHIADLRGIEISSDTVVIGAATTHCEVATSEEIRSALPTLAGLAGSIGDVHVRHMGTIGGSVANNDPAADYPAAVLALDAVVHTDRRAIPADAFFAGLYATSLEQGEIVVRIAFKRPIASGYAKFRNPASRYALAASFVARYDGGVRVAVTGAGAGGVFRWTTAEAALAGSFDAGSLEGLAANPHDMMDDIHAPADYRAHLVGAMTRRAVQNIGSVSVSP